jgi:hypothetical protein
MVRTQEARAETNAVTWSSSGDIWAEVLEKNEQQPATQYDSTSSYQIISEPSLVFFGTYSYILLLRAYHFGHLISTFNI